MSFQVIFCHQVRFGAKALWAYRGSWNFIGYKRPVVGKLEAALGFLPFARAVALDIMKAQKTFLFPTPV